ncbi:MAG: GreA/GreB family elongation factor [Pseudomonadota bacterium]
MPAIQASASPQAPRVLTDIDHQRLFDLVERQGTAASGSDTHHTIDALMDVLDFADLVPSKAVPGHIVTMRSRVVLMGQAHGSTRRLTLSYPHDDVSGGLSVLTPLGTALLGTRVGQQVNWTGLDGATHHAVVAAIQYQPEAAGQLHL